MSAEPIEKIKNGSDCFLKIDMDQRWLQTSPISVHAREDEELAAYFMKCLNIHGACPAIWDGKFYTCGRAGVYDLLGYPMGPEEYVNIRAYNSPQELRKAITSFFSKIFFKTCNYCDNVDDAAKPLIKPGEQMRKLNTPKEKNKL